MTLPHPPVEDSALVQWAHQVLVRLGLKPETAHLLDQFVIIAAILLTAWLMDWLFRTILLAVGQRIIRHTQRRWSELLLNRQVLRKFSDLTPVAFVYLLIPLAFPAQSHLPVLIRKICVIYEIFVFTLVLNVILKVFFGLLSLKDVKHERPLKGLLQLLQIGLFCVSGIAIVSLLFGQSPLRLLTGLGASAAILMLVFKDTIMGFVAGVRLSADKILRPGDWISMPKYDIDGTVIDISLTTIKIQNFDNTVTSLPPFLLTEDAFKNWRWMKESGGRRIMRSLSIDMSSVHFCTAEMLDRYRQNPWLRDYIDRHEAQRTQEAHNPDPSIAMLSEFSKLTNLTLFRTYLNLYLTRLSVVNHDLTYMVRYLQPTSTGIPVEIYCFSVVKEWKTYEGIQADMFDHIMAAVPDFDLVLFQEPSGHDFRELHFDLWNKSSFIPNK